MNSNPAPESAQNSTAEQLQAYIKYLPALLNTTAASTLPVGQATQKAQDVLAPEQQALESSLYANTAPGLYATGSNLNQQNTAAGLSNALKNLQGTGGQLATTAQQQQEQLDPQFYAARAAAGNQLSNLLGSINVNSGLTGSEQQEVGKGLAQQDAQKGILNSPSQTAAVSNAFQYGKAGEAVQQSRQNTLANAINSATSFLPQSQSGISAFNIGTGAATTQANPGASEFLGATNTPANSAATSNAAAGAGLGTNIGNTATNQANLLAASQQTPNKTAQLLGSLPT